jgi:hypothetical protein
VCIRADLLLFVADVGEAGVAENAARWTRTGPVAAEFRKICAQLAGSAGVMHDLVRLAHESVGAHGSHPEFEFPLPMQLSR